MIAVGTPTMFAAPTVEESAEVSACLGVIVPSPLASLLNLPNVCFSI